MSLKENFCNFSVDYDAIDIFFLKSFLKSLVGGTKIFLKKKKKTSEYII